MMKKTQKRKRGWLHALITWWTQLLLPPRFDARPYVYHPVSDEYDSLIEDEGPGV